MSDSDERQLVSLLRQLQPGFQSLDIFLELMRIMVASVYEVVPLRSGPAGTVEVLLLQRDADDPFWPAMWHTPGTVLRAPDTAQPSLPIARIKAELGGTELSEPVFVYNLLHTSKRGAEQAQVYWAEVQGEPKKGTFFPAASLPADIVPSQYEFIEQAVRTSKASR